jgi:hypothetical protein
MRLLIISCLLIASGLAVLARDVRVLIAPRTIAIPSSGQVIFDIYWVNDGEKAVTIPALERYTFFFSPVGPSDAEVGFQLRTVDHSGPDRKIAPRSIIHENATAEIGARGANLVEVTAEFRGNRSRYKSNKVILRREP